MTEIQWGEGARKRMRDLCRAADANPWVFPVAETHQDAPMDPPPPEPPEPTPRTHSERRTIICGVPYREPKKESREKCQARVGGALRKLAPSLGLAVRINSGRIYLSHLGSDVEWRITWDKALDIVQRGYM